MEGQKFCSACGQPFEAGDVFCQSCGAKREEETGLKNHNVKGIRNKRIVVIAILIIAAGTITGFSLFGKSYAIERVIQDTLALESGNIEITYRMESEDYEDKESYEIEFLKSNKEKTILIETDYQTIYASAKDGKFRSVTSWGEEEYDFEDELGLDASKLEKALIDYFVGSFKGQETPEGCIENLKINKEKRGTVITGNIEDEAELLEWIYECFDKDELKELILNNMTRESDAKDYIESEWDYEADSMHDEIDRLDSELDDYDVDSSFEILIDKKGILDRAEIVLGIEDSNWDETYSVTVSIKLTDKNDIDHIEEPEFD